MKTTLWRFLLLTGLLALSCSRQTTPLSDPEQYRDYLSGYTGATISRTSPILLHFTAPYGQDKEAQALPGRILELAPKTAGQLRWADPYTLRFDPEAPLQTGTAYTATVRLDQVIEGLPEALRTFTFRFQTRQQHLHLQLDDLDIPEEDRPHDFALSGTLFTHDFANSQDVEKCLKLPGGAAKFSITWTHDQQGHRHQFRLYPLAAGDADQPIRLEWQGKPLGTSQGGSETVLIPARNRFRVLNSRQGQGTQSEVHLTFSRLLDQSQQLDGLIYLESAPNLIPTFHIQGNRVICYFPQRLEGPHQLKVLTGVRQRDGGRLDQPYQHHLQFSQTPPAVREVGNGIILPHARELYFPFEAVNLDAVDVEIFKIYRSNILHFLQVNDLDGQYEIERVGKIVWKGKVDLAALNPERNHHDFVRYALDLSRLMEPDPEAIYQVRIGFWKAYSAYRCDPADTPAAPEDADPAGGGHQTPEEDGWVYTPAGEEEESSLMDYYYGRRGWHRHYNWENQDNPCAEEYYASHRFLSRNILASNLGITVKRSTSGDILAVVSDLRTAAPVAGAEITFHDYQTQIVHRGKTGSDGIYLGASNTKMHLAVVRRGTDIGYLVLREHQALSISDFPTEGVAVQQGLRGWAYTERGVWRPGDSVFLNLVLVDHDQRLPPNYPVTMELYDPRDRQVLRQVQTKPAGSIYPFHLALPDDGMTGVWRARFLAGGATFHHAMRVETIKPNRYKLQLDLGKARLSRKDEPLTAALHAQWLHGAPAPFQDAQIEVRTVSVPTSFKDYPGFIFDHPGRPLIDQTVVWQKGQTNAQGRLDLGRKPLVDALQAPGRLRVDFKYRVTEPGGGFSQDFRSVPYDLYTHYTGIKSSRHSQADPSYQPREVIPLQLATVDASGKPAPGRKLNLRILKLEWRWWWESYANNRSLAIEDEYQEEVHRETVQTGSDGQVRWTTRLEEASRYLVEICDQVSGHCSAQELFVYDQSSPGRTRELHYFSFQTDKEVCLVGDEFSIHLPAGPEGHALISLESGSRILEARMVPLGKEASRHTIKVTAAMSPNVYVHVSLLQPHSRENDHPLRLYGIQSVKVELPRSRLEPEVKAPAEMRPEQTYTISVKEKQKQGMAYTLALVDEGLLDLTRFATPDPHKALFRKQALGVKSWDMFDLVLGGFTGDLKRIVSIGGDGAAARPDGHPKANRFKPAIRHLGPFYLPPGQTATHEVTMPPYVGSVRLMVVAIGDQAFGHTEQTIAVRKPLMTAATLPRQLGPGESMDLAVTVFALTGQVKNASVTVKDASGLLSFSGPTTRNVTFDKPGEQTLLFPVKSSARSGVARMAIEARSGKELSRHDLEIEVRNPNPLQTLTYEKVLQPGESQVFQAPLPGTTGTNTAMLLAMSLPPISLESRLNYLLHYPYGCLEQTTSAAMPLLFLPALMELPEPTVRMMRDRVSRGIQRILQMRDGQGRLSYWPQGQYVHPWSEVYAFLFLARAREAGYAVPDAAWKELVQAQKRLANSWDGQDTRQQEQGPFRHTIQAFRLYALASAGESALGALNRLRDRADLSELDQWLIAGAYARAGKMAVAQAITAKLPRQVPAYRDNRITFGSDLRDQALICLVLQDMNDQAGAFSTLRGVARQLNSSSWHSTQDIAMGLWAYARYGAGQTNRGQMAIAVTSPGGQRQQFGSDRAFLRQHLSTSGLHNQPLRVENLGSSEIAVQLALSGRPPVGQEEAHSRGIELRIIYFGMDDHSLDIRRLPVGTDFLAVAEVWHRSSTSDPIPEVVLHQAIPSGWEIRHTRLETWGEAQTALPNMTYKYRDIRDASATTFFDLHKKRNQEGTVQPQRYMLALTAAYPGRFYLPAQQVSAMYDDQLSASIPGQWIEVYSPDQSENQ